MKELNTISLWVIAMSLVMINVNTCSIVDSVRTIAYRSCR